MVVSRSKKPARAALSAPARPDAARESGDALMTHPAVREGKNRRPLALGNAGPRHLAHYPRRAGPDLATWHATASALTRA